MRFLVAAAILVAACSPNEPTATPNLDPSAPSADVSALPGDVWGPLAVIPPQDGADTARTEGRLRITNTCVFLESPGGVMLLFWPSDRTAWAPEPPTITFANFDGSIVTVRDGDDVVLGGRVTARPRVASPARIGSNGWSGSRRRRCPARSPSGGASER